MIIFFILLILSTTSVYATTSEVNLNVTITNQSTQTETSSVNDSTECNNPKPESIPSIYQVLYLSPTSVRIMFTKSLPPLTGYVIEYGKNDSNFIYSAIINDPTITSYDINSLEPSSEYYFRIRGINGCNASGWSSSVFYDRTDNQNRVVSENIVTQSLADTSINYHDPKSNKNVVQEIKNLDLTNNINENGKVEQEKQNEKSVVLFSSMSLVGVGSLAFFISKFKTKLFFH